MSSISHLQDRTENTMENLKYVYKTHYKMAEWYERFSNIESMIVAGGTGLLATVIIWGAASREILLTIAVIVALLSWIDAVMNFGIRSTKHFDAADAYHTLYEDFKDFHNLKINSEGDYDALLSEYEDLKSRRERIKQGTPRTTNFWFNRLDSSSISEEIQRDLQSS